MGRMDATGFRIFRTVYELLRASRTLMTVTNSYDIHEPLRLVIFYYFNCSVDVLNTGFAAGAPWLAISFRSSDYPKPTIA